MDKRMPCEVCGKNEGWISLYGRWVCGECVAAWDKKLKDSEFEKLKEVLNGS